MRPLDFLLSFSIFICLVISGCHAKPMTENEATQEYLEKLLMSGYNKNILPVSSEGHGRPLQVRCTLYLLDIHKVDETSMDYRAQFYFRQSWNDSRLAYLDRDISTVVLSDSKFIWTPDLFFKQEKEGIVHNLIAPNVFIRISPEGEVLFSLRMSVTFSCPMDFRKYPHDTQKCLFTVESYGFNRDQMQLNWDDKQPYQAVESSDEIDLLTFTFKGIKEGIKHLSEKFGEYTHLEVELTFQRKLGFFITKLYVPFTFLIAISWLSSWIPVKLIVPRLSLLLVIMYLMVNIGSDVNNYVPPASYTKGSDVWIAFCESLVFASFLEFIAVYIIFRNKENFQNRICKTNFEAQVVPDCDDKKNGRRIESANSALNMLSIRLQTNVLVSSRIDKATRVLFPILFLVFNFIYWIVYATGH